MESATADFYNFLVRQIFQESGSGLIRLKARTKSAVGAISPQVDFLRLSDSRAMTLSSANLNYAHIW